MNRHPCPQINYLRISITDRCNLRCFYCLPPGGWEKLPCPGNPALRGAAAPGRGGRRGGHPQAPGHRRRAPGAPGRAGVHPPPAPGSRDRGSLPHHQRRAPGGAGPGPFRPPACATSTSAWTPCAGTVTGRSPAPTTSREVMAGLEAGRGPGLSPHQDQLRGLERHKRRRTPGLRPPDPGPSPSRCASSNSCPRWTRRAGAATSCPWPRSAGAWRSWAPWRRVTAPPPPARPGPSGPRGFRGELGFISSVSDHHCPTCNRLRLTAAGWLRPCLFAAPELDIKGPLRQGASDAALAQLFREAIRLKDCLPPPPPWPLPGPAPSMVSIGG